jgi:hypothetical protein
MGPRAGIPQELAGHFCIGYRASHNNPFVQISFLWIYSTMSARGEDVAAIGGRTEKGRNFCPGEEEQCCRSFMHTSIESRRGIGQKNAAFWTSIASHYARHKPDGGVDRPARSLETKWRDIKVVVAKFTGCYWTIKDVDESGK